ncbi:MAG: type II secretion system F family protein [Pseudomonadota bacterium]
MDLSGDLLIYIIGGLAFLVIAGAGIAFTAESGGEKAAKRAKQVAAGETMDRKGGRESKDPNAARRKQTQQMLKKLRAQDEERRKSLNANDLQSKLNQAGLAITPQVFLIICAILGIAFAGLTFASGATALPKLGPVDMKEMLGEEVSRIVMVIGAAIGGGIGFPNWVLAFLAKGRNKKILNQFGDGIDIVVRGVKSGLPLTECLRIIAIESGPPLGPEFQQLTDNVQMGMTMEKALQQFYKRVPLPEVNFFVIVLSIQAKAGGNLSEALGNLSNVIRSRRMMREKIKALSSEAKASAMIIGCLPFAVAFMVYLTTPSYIMMLFTEPTGHMILFMAFCLMATGITVMRKMINFDF